MFQNTAYKPQQSIAQEIHPQLTAPMEGGVATRDDVFGSHSLKNRIKPQFDYIEKPPSIVRAQLTAKPASRRVTDSEISIFDAQKYFNGAHDTRENSSSSSNHKNGGVYAMSNSNRRLSLCTPKQSISSIPRLSSVSDDSYGRNYRARASRATPTASSEASWNSQTGLLMHPITLAPVSIRNLPIAADRTSRKTRGSMKWLLRGNKCPCSGKKSVNVEESNSESEAIKTPPAPPRIVQLNRIRSGGGGAPYSSTQSSPKTKSNLTPDEAIRNFDARPQLNQHRLITTNSNPKSDEQLREKRFSSDRVAVTVKAFADGSGATSNGFTFPILSSSANSSKRIFNIVQPITVSAVGGSAGDAPRDSLEVFQLQDDGVCRNFTGSLSPQSRRASYEDEMCSDASSDLFEIESFSTTTQSTVFARRDSLDDPAANFNMRRLQISIAGVEEQDEEETVTPSIAQTECYAPSEVSVDWSVTTAEGFDRASLARFSVSESEVAYATLVKGAKSGASGVTGDGESRRRGNGGLLTSCRREKAVNVGPIPIKCRQAQRVGM